MDILLINLYIYSLFNDTFSSPDYIYAYVTYVGLCMSVSLHVTLKT
jgi:hypothetical protein